MDNNAFQPQHINATAEDMLGNNGIGRYFFLPGSPGRAREIAEHFSDLHVKPHHRAENLYLGTLTHTGQTIEVAAISTGMGSPSVEIILHELIHLGAKRFLRVGTAGSLQPDWLRVGALINALASVRDEDTSSTYVPLEVPAVASLEFVLAVQEAAKKLNLQDKIYTGTVHCKSSLYAREFDAGPRVHENHAYLQVLKDAGVLASEMETSTLFIMSSVYDNLLRKRGTGPQFRIFAGAVLAIISDTHLFDHTDKSTHAVHEGILLALETVKTLAIQELSK